MCGINGLLYKEATNNISEQLKLMNACILHRGPDDGGIYYTDRSGMGMRRLSIIDLSTGTQPMQNASEDMIVVFNGEIYNYRDLKLEMEREGVEFTTQSDTEVVLKLYQKYGEDMLAKLNGMFVFSIYDKQKGRLFIARDRFGEKPLYYHQNDDVFVWASELKSIIALFPQLKKISTEALTLFFSLSYIPAPYSIYKNVYKLLPGHYLMINTNNSQAQLYQYWDIDTSARPDPGITYTDAKKEIRELLFESVEKRMIADVPLGVFLSGGVDSTIVASIMAKVSGQKIKTFSVGYSDPRYDESARARQVANHINSEHHEYVLNYDDIFGNIDKIVLNYDEPYADSSCLPTYFIASKTVEHVKVALTGDGGDEVFGGYNKYMLPYYSNIYKKYVPRPVRSTISDLKFNEGLVTDGGPRSVIAKIKKVSGLLNLGLVPGHLNLLALGFRQHELDILFINGAMDHIGLIEKLIIHNDPTNDGLKQLRYIDKQVSLEGDMLVKVDRASMLCSLECRSPFLDHRLMEYTYRLPDDHLIKKGNKKRILKDTFSDLLPKDFFNSPKLGFEVPVGQWFRGPLKNDMLNMLSRSQIEQSGLFNFTYVEKLTTDHVAGKANNGYKLWALYCFQKWFNKNMVD